MNLLMRFYDIDSGKIMISNQNLGEIARGTLRPTRRVRPAFWATTPKPDNNLKYANAQAIQDEKNIDIRSFARYNTDRQEVA